MDTLQGINSNAIFDIHSDRIEYTVGANKLLFTLIENLVGGDADDTFRFHGNAQLPGLHNSIDGKSGQDTLDYIYDDPITVYLIGGVCTG